uniref:Uncharacterized protein n=1 Tax=Candidatus Kentrum sp. TC TaxID=2126339 RepID=A0A451AF96_9GAMM|nr:MAG: hypothetical protein BECKTC1821E_GA0114239_11522 [Candidatus Kentron sp. TC]VFK52066.1 MAG: hypothetical protein BECKTC1821D_GA0114238_11532 [Candidatus Kentron sp. TC]VFK64730.1 MAG: hypothetical protein BECKTC1821F_GA0114240_11414 [Candidatus Kentron sp. TC]
MELSRTALLLRAHSGRTLGSELIKSTSDGGVQIAEKNSVCAPNHSELRYDVSL